MANEWATFNQAAPAWVQAVGSVAAVYLAGRTVVLSSRSARLDKLYGADAIFRLASSAISDARASFIACNGQAESPDMFDRERFVYAGRLLKQLESGLVEIGSEKLPILTGEAQITLRNAENAFTTALSTTRPSEAASKLLHELDQHSVEMENKRAQVLKFVSRQRRLTKWWWAPWSTDT